MRIPLLTRWLEDREERERQAFLARKQTIADPVLYARFTTVVDRAVGGAEPETWADGTRHIDLWWTAKKQPDLSVQKTFTVSGRVDRQIFIETGRDDDDRDVWLGSGDDEPDLVWYPGSGFTTPAEFLDWFESVQQS